MADPLPIEGLSVKALSHPLARSFETHLGEFVNVKGFGAKGNGSDDDTAAIQAAFDYAYGTWDDPHGGPLATPRAVDLVHTNKPVYFPAGKYMVSSSHANIPITGMENAGPNANGAINNVVRITTNTAGLATGDNINIAGMNPSYVNGSWFIIVDDATHCTLLWCAYSTAFVSGGTYTTPCLRMRMVYGGFVFGAGRSATKIESKTLNAAVICTNACSFTRFENISFAAEGGGICFQLDWKNVNPANTDPGSTSALQSNTFFNCMFGGIGGHPEPKYGLCIGTGFNMGSETLILNCYFGGCAVAGVYTANLNACDNTMIGGNISYCGTGIYVDAGSVNTIHGVSFQHNVLRDIYVRNGAEDSYSVNGCRSESPNFFEGGFDQPYHISACNQTLGDHGFFFFGGGHVTIDTCSAVNGYINAQNADVEIRNCMFHRADYLTAGGTQNYRHLTITPMPITQQTNATYTIGSHDGGSRIQFDSSALVPPTTGQTVTIPKNSDGSIRLWTGTKIEVQQVGAGQTTFVGASGVTIRSRGGALKLNGQWACGLLTCDGPDLWTLSGDIVV